jgi:RNA polymerase sigma-70 factor (ECF subfamily)
MLDDPSRLVEQLHGRYGGALREGCLRLLGDSDDAEDVVQETFLRLLAEGPRAAEGGYLFWLQRVALRFSRRVLRARRRSERPRPDLCSTRAGPEIRVLLWQVLDLLARRLDERAVTIVLASGLEGATQGEVARELGISRRAVVKRLGQMRALTRRLAGGPLGDFGAS